MGRRPYGTGSRKHCRLFRLRFVDGCYDDGGAYWGAPANVWVCLDDDLEPIAFVRASSRQTAYSAVVEMIGSVKLARAVTCT